MGKDKYSYLVKNTLLFTISSFGSKILVFLLVPLYTSILSTADYGISDLITTTATLLIYIITINIADSVLRFSIDAEKNKEKYLKYGLQILLYSSIMLIIGLFLVYKVGYLKWKPQYYIFLFLQFFSLAFYQIVSNFLRAIDKVKEVAVSGIITTFITVILNIILLVLLKMGIYGYLISMVSGSFVSSLYCTWVARSYVPALFKAQVDRDTKINMRGYSIPLIFNNVSWWMNTSIDRYFVAGICGTAANGIYAVSYKIPTIMSVAHSVFSQAWNLSAIKEYDKNDSDGFFSKTYGLYNALLVLLCSLLIILNIPIAKILFSKDFFTAWEYSSVLLVSIVFSSLGGFLGSIFTAVKDTKIFAVSTVISAVINCILNAVLIPQMGTIGAAIATLIAFFFIWLIRLICTRKYIIWRMNVVKDLIAYIILITQVFIEHTQNHGYMFQMITFGILLVVYKEQVAMCSKTVIQKFNSIVRRR